MKTAVAALIISSFSFIVAVISCVIAVKNYRKSKRLEFYQRRDLWSQRISELNVENSQGHLISARYEMVIQQLMTLTATSAEHIERINKQITRIKKLREGIDERTKLRDDGIDEAHVLCSKLKFGDRVTNIENLIALTQGVTDNAKRSNEISLGSLHILETTEPLLRGDLDQLKQYEMQLAELDSMAKKLNEIAPAKSI